MPGKNGIEVLQELRVRIPDLKVLMISGNASSEMVKEAIALGVSGFIVKPFNAEQVLSRMQQLAGA
jgi:two-component system chemotaxis response regulator CheY